MLETVGDCELIAESACPAVVRSVVTLCTVRREGTWCAASVIDVVAIHSIFIEHTPAFWRHRDPVDLASGIALLYHGSIAPVIAILPTVIPFTPSRPCC